MLGTRVVAALLLAGAAGAQAQTDPDATPAAPGPAAADVGGTAAGPPATTAIAPPAPAPAPAPALKSLFGNLSRVPDEFTLVSDKPRLSFHKPMYVLPATYSDRYTGDESELVFQLSMKMRLFGSNLFFAYTQKSFWQTYNASDSRPFRETNYNPELFYRWKPDFALCPGCGADFGGEHESNGKDVPDSRSWNRIYAALFYEWDRTLVDLKLWYRIPEDAKKNPEDPKGDDNPDIEHYLGYGELRVQQELFADKHLAALMVRGNPATGKGAVEFNYSVPFGDYLYWNVYVFNGYGDSLIDYKRSVTRVGAGIMLAR